MQMQGDVQSTHALRSTIESVFMLSLEFTQRLRREASCAADGDAPPGVRHRQSAQWEHLHAELRHRQQTQQRIRAIRTGDVGGPIGIGHVQLDPGQSFETESSGCFDRR